MTHADIFIVGNDTIDAMNTLTTKVRESSDSAKMVSVINGLKKSVDRFHSYSNIGFFKKMFTTNIEIEANIKIAHIEFETLLKNGSNIYSQLKSQYESFDMLYRELEEVHNKFNDDIEFIENYLATSNPSQSDIQRLIRRKEDLISAQLLAKTTAMQYDLCKNNIGILMDKFNSIEKVLKPALEQNIKFSKKEIKINF